jgi:hypothetical protein
MREHRPCNSLSWGGTPASWQPPQPDRQPPANPSGPHGPTTWPGRSYKPRRPSSPCKGSQGTGNQPCSAPPVQPPAVRGILSEGTSQKVTSTHAKCAGMGDTSCWWANGQVCKRLSAYFPTQQNVLPPNLGRQVHTRFDLPPPRPATTLTGTHKASTRTHHPRRAGQSTGLGTTYVSRLCHADSADHRHACVPSMCSGCQPVCVHFYMSCVCHADSADHTLHCTAVTARG